jgi:hypothetical protein
VKSNYIIPVKEGPLSPDYIQGPWLPLPEEFPFEKFTNRPRLNEAIHHLQQVKHTFQAIANVTSRSRAAEQQQEIALIAEGKDAVKRIGEEISQIEKRDQFYHQIVPIQQQITGVIHELAAQLHDVSHLYQSDAEIRFPVVERVTEYTIDLQNALRAKDDVVCKLVMVMPPLQLKAITEKYDHVISTIREKLDKEMHAASQLLDPLRVHINLFEHKINTSRNHIGELSSRLHQAVIGGEGFIQNEKWVKELALKDEQRLVDGVQLAIEVQDKVIAGTREIFDEQMGQWYHVVSLLTALVEQETHEILQSPFEPLAAMVVPSHDDE